MKKSIRICAAGALAALLAFAAQAQTFPAKPVRIVVPFGPGGVADIVARTVAPKLTEGLGQQVVIENKPSAGGIVAAEAVARAEPDGHTLLLISNGNAVSSALFKSLPYDPLNDFAMISTMGFFGLVVVTDAKSPARTLQEAIALAKASPGKLNIGTIGLGSTQNLAAELFRSTAGVDMQIIPYKATPEVFAAMKQHDAHIAFEILAPVMGQLRAGSLRALAVTTGKRFPGLPEVPTAIESGLAGYDVSSWNGLAAPAKTPPAAIERMQREVARALAAADLQQRLLEIGVEARASTPAELRELFVSESRRWTRVIEAANIPKR
jgi:tripartite-type tricarboxylate transporter receptor subunit TctC